MSKGMATKVTFSSMIPIPRQVKSFAEIMAAKRQAKGGAAVAVAVVPQVQWAEEGVNEQEGVYAEEAYDGAAGGNDLEAYGEGYEAYEETGDLDADLAALEEGL